MSNDDSWDDSPRRSRGYDDSIIPTRSIEAFGRKVTATAGHLLGDTSASQHYQNALGEIHREMRNPLLQRQVLSLAHSSPRELVRSKLSPNEIQHRALTYLPDELLEDIPENNNSYSLFQGFQASIPEQESRRKRRHSRRSSRSQGLLEGGADSSSAPPVVSKLRNEKQGLDHRLEMMEVRKNMCSTEIREIDNKIANLNTMRKIVLDRLADLEQEETQLERDLFDVDTRLEDLEEELEDAAILSDKKTPTLSPELGAERADSPGMEASFMSESIYEKLPSPKPKRPRSGRRKTNFILHEHLQAGSKIRQIQAHNDIITALDFDVPFGTMVTAALDDTVRVWDLNAGRCMGLLEGHLSSVRCLQVEDNIVATGSMDASVRLWDLNLADYTPQPDSKHSNKSSARHPEDEGDHDTDEEDDAFADASSAPPTPPPSNMADCPLLTLSAHISEVTALHFHNTTLISGSADKTLRQWDLEKGRCVQTLDVLWAAAHADRSVRIWDLRTGTIFDAFAFESPVSGLMFDARSIAAAAGEDVVKVYDKADGRHWDCGEVAAGQATVERVRLKDGYLIEGRRDGTVGVWSC